MRAPAPRWARIVATMRVAERTMYYEYTRVYGKRLGALNDDQRQHLAESVKAQLPPNPRRMAALGKPTA